MYPIQFLLIVFKVRRAHIVPEAEADMGTKMKKGILKPLKYFSQIFDNKEDDMQIGFPTDVKHVAHIGWDGPSVSSPSWMKEYHSAPLGSSCGEDGRESSPPESWGSQEFASGGMEDSSVRQAAGRSKPSSSAVEPSPDSPDLLPASTKPKHSRRHQSDGSMSGDSVEAPRRSRKPRKKEAAGPSDSPGQDMPAIPKQSHRKKNKGSSSTGGSVKSSKSKAPTSAPPAGEESNTKPSSEAAEEDYRVQ
ncbi:unnamed protein product [Musa hybrid cultivar]